MCYVIFSVKNTKPVPPVVLSKDSNDKLLFQKGENVIYLSSLDSTLENTLPDMGSSIGNVIFIFENEFQIDPQLETNSEKGIIEFKEPEQVADIDVTRTVLGEDEVLTYHFHDVKTARRYIDKKMFGEIYLIKAAKGNDLTFYPQLKEIYLFGSNSLEVGLLGYLDCGNTINAPSAKVTELAVAPAERKTYTIKNSDAVFEIPILKKYRIDFVKGSGMNLIRMNRGKREVKDGAGQSYWKLQDEILKIYIGEE